MGDMPDVNMDYIKSNLSNDELEIALAVIKKNKNGYTIRASMPSRNSGGDAYYVWRMVAFYVSPKSQHHCIPACADFKIPDEHIQNYGSSDEYSFKKRKNYIEQRLEPIVDTIVNSVPKNQWYGVHRWAKAFSGIPS